MTPRDALRLATRGGAEVLGRSDIGQITPGCCADFALYRLDTLALAGGAVHDPVGALLLCSSGQADMTLVHGEVLVREGRLTRVEIEPLIARHNALARELVSGVS
jgi:8-oxoguanine deaminase